MGRIVFIGGGNMASALIGGMIANAKPRPALAIVEPFEAQRARLAQRFDGVPLHAEASADLVKGAALVVLAVKPQQMPEACAAVAPGIEEAGAVLSIAAGTRIADISRWLSGYQRIVRAMPNTPAMIGAGISGVYAPPAVDAPGRGAAESVLAAAGEVIWCANEEMLDAVTGVSGSGPAYVFYFLEALEQAGCELGLPAGDARKFAYATFDGAVRLARHSTEDPATLRAQVTSKGGTTARGIDVLDDAGVRQGFIRAVKAAAERARELGDMTGPDNPLTPAPLPQAGEGRHQR